MEDFNLSVVIVTGLDTLMKYVFPCSIDHPRMCMLLRLTSPVIKGLTSHVNILPVFHSLIPLDCDQGLERL